MGSFNATCSLSDLTISCGDECLLFPLLPTRFNSDKHGVIKIEPSSMYVSNEGAYMFFVPMCFPIKGTYNDYGSIENIVEDENTKAIEKYFGMTIEQFISIITDNRKGMTDSYSDTFQIFAIDKEIFEYNIHLNEKYLTRLGFTLKDEKEQTYLHLDNPEYLVKLIPLKINKEKHQNKPFTYQIINANNGTIKKTSIDSYYIEKNLINDYYEVTNYYLNVKKEDQDKVSFLLATSGMFILQEIYDFYTKETVPKSFGSEKSLTSAVVESMGFKFRCKDETIERYNLVYEFPGITDYILNSDGTWSRIVKTTKAKPNTGQEQEFVYNPNNLIKVWKKLTGIDLPISKEFLNKSEYDFNFETLQKDLKVFNEELQKERKEDEEYSKKLQNILIDEKLFNEELNEWIIELKKREEENKKHRDSKNIVEELEEELKEEEEEFKNISSIRRDFSKELKEILRVNSLLISDSVSLEEKKILYRKRLESNIERKNSTDKLDSSLLSYKNPLKEDELMMQFPVPRYSFKGFNFISKIYFDLILDGTIKKYLVDYCHFYWGMYENHRIYSPAQYGSQEDNSPSRKALAEKIIEISIERKKYYGNEEEEED